VTRIAIVREEGLDYLVERGICLRRHLSRSIGSLPPAVKDKENSANKREQKAQRSPEIRAH